MGAMMKYSVLVVCLVMTSLSGYTHCNKVNSLERQLVKLAGRQTLDSIAREELNERLKYVEKALNDSTEQSQCCANNMQSSDDSTISPDTSESFVDNEVFLRLVKAFKDEKASTGRMRRHVTTNLNSLDEHLRNVSYDLASIRTEMCTASESRIISTVTESVKSEIENISQEVQITKAEVADAIDKMDRVQESLTSHIGDVSEILIKPIFNVINSLKDDFENVGKSIKSISDRISHFENSSKSTVERLKTIERTVATISQRVWQQSCLNHYNAGSKNDGIYTVYLKDYDKIIDVYCDMTTDGGGWTVFQRRKDGTVDFYRNWQDYKQGFGNNLTGGFWLGNDNIVALTDPCCHELRIDLKDFDNKTTYAKYGKFNVLPESENYKLYLDIYSGNAGDSFLKRHNNMSFSTKDRDNDVSSYDNCAELYMGGWWYEKCYGSNLNGLYDKTLGSSNQRIKRHNGKHWEYLAMTEMKFR